MWKIGIFNLFAAMVLKTLLVSPKTNKASGFSAASISYDFEITLPIVSPKCLPATFKKKSGFLKS